MEGKKITLLGELGFCIFFYKMYHKLLDIDEIITPDTTENYKTELEKIPVSVNNYRSTLIDEFTECREKFIIVCDINVRKYDDVMYKSALMWKDDYIEAFYIQMYFSKKIKQSMKNKNIWIFGAGNNGCEFYNNHKDLNICGFISNYENEHDFLGLPVLRPCELFNDTKNIDECYIVICSDAAAEMEEILQKYNLSLIDNYCIHHQYMKKLFISIGNCQINDIMMILQYNTDFKNQYYLINFFTNMYIECSLSDRLRMNMYGNICDAVFYNAGDAQDTYKGIIQRFYSTAIKIYMPFYSFHGQHMQIGNNENTYAVRDDKNECVYWLRGDKEINNLVEQGVDKDTIIKMVSSDDYWKEEEILINWKKSIKKIEVLDRISDLKILPFIKQNFQIIPIFRDSIHFRNELIIELSNQISDILGFSHFTETDQKKAVENVCYVKCTQPVYPSVAKVMNMSFVKPDTKYAFLRKNPDTIEYIDFKEYAERYINHVYSFRNMDFYVGI